MSDPGHVGPAVYPSWLDVARQVLMFALGVFLILWSVFTPGYDIPFLVTALILLGLVPAERVLMRKVVLNGGSVEPEGDKAPSADPPLARYDDDEQWKP